MKLLSKHKSNNAFTLIEALVIMTIIVILVGIVIISTRGPRAFAKDKKRMLDLAGYDVALQEYYSKNKSYPKQSTSPPSEDNCEAWNVDCSYVANSDGKNNPACDCPATEVLAILKTDGFLENIPKDPENTETEGIYRYRYISYNGGKDYKLYVQLEKDKIAMANDGGFYPSAQSQFIAYYEICSDIGCFLAIKGTQSNGDIEFKRPTKGIGEFYVKNISANPINIVELYDSIDDGITWSSSWAECSNTTLASGAFCHMTYDEISKKGDQIKVGYQSPVGAEPNKTQIFDFE